MKSKVVKKYFNYYKRIRVSLKQSIYCYYLKRKIKDKFVFLESRNGNLLGDNILCLMREMQNPQYKVKRIYFGVKKEKREEVRRISTTYGLNYRMVNLGSIRYYRALAISKYLFTDTTFSYGIVKRDDQIMTNTWHGTPIKKMGKYNERERFDIGNVQRCFLMSDYIVCQGECIKDRLTDAYMLKNLFKGTFLFSGSPRNSFLFDKDRRGIVRKALGWEDKEIIIYMPTFRSMSYQNNESVKANNLQCEYIYNSMMMIDEMLGENQLFVVKLHPYINKMLDFSTLNHVVNFPKSNYILYDILNATDILVTDYSSVMYDYINAGRRIILWAYDQEQYESERGQFQPISELPFTIVKTTEDLIEELTSSNSVNPDYIKDESLAYYIRYDGDDAAKKICQRVFNNQVVCEEIKLPSNGKENVLLFGGGLVKNGITTALVDLLNKIDSQKRNYILCFNRWNFIKTPLFMNKVPDGFDFIMLSSSGPYTLKELFCLAFLVKKEKQTQFMSKCFDHLYQRELKRLLVKPDHYDYILDFEGYQNYNIKLFQRMKCPRYLWVHNDMEHLIAERKDLNMATELDAYENFDKILPITEDITAPLINLGCLPDKIKVVHNCFDCLGSIEKSAENIELQKDTCLRVKFAGGIDEALQSNGIKMINIGRYSIEKQHYKLLDAFEMFYKDHPDAILIIIGGHGPLYQKTLTYIDKLSCWKNVICIKGIDNPLPILKKCDLFVLSSSFEGMPITIKEADSLEIPVICTDIPGPHSFMNKYNGYLVEQTVEALYEGMLAFERGEIGPMRIDFEAYNKMALNEFEELFNS